VHGYGWNMGWNSMWMFGVALIIALALIFRGRR